MLDSTSSVLNKRKVSKIKEKCNDQVLQLDEILYSLWNKKLKKNKWHIHTALIYSFCHSKSIERERRKANSYCDREQTRDCIGGRGTPRLTTLCENRGSSSLLLQWFHLLLVCLLFLCKPRKPTCVTLKLSSNVYTRQFTWFS